MTYPYVACLSLCHSRRPLVYGVDDRRHSGIQTEGVEARRKGVVEAEDTRLLVANNQDEASYGPDLCLCVDEPLSQPGVYNVCMFFPTAYDLFHLRRARNTVKAFAGLSSAILRYASQ